jgi:hypothetical protein
MGIIDTISSIFTRAGSRAGATVQTPDTTTQAMPEPRRAVALVNPFQRETGRSLIVKATRAMFMEDPRVRRIITDFSSDVAAARISANVIGNPKAQATIDAMFKRLSLHSLLDDWMRATLKDGDGFFELGVDEQRQIALVTRKPTLEMIRNTDRFDLFKDPAAAFYWTGDMPTFGREIPDGAVPFAQWQIVHARWDHDSGARYGFPLFGSATQIYQYVQDGEKNMAIRRKVRSGMRIAHNVQGGQDAVDEYMRNNQDAVSDPYVAIAEYFGNSQITAIQGDANLAQIEDVKHHIATLGFASPLTMGLLGYGENLNRDVLDDQAKKYKTTLANTRAWLSAEIVRPMVNVQLLLAGMLPDDVEYEIQYHAEPKEPRIEDLQAALAAASQMQLLGIAPEVIEAVLLQYVPQIAAALATAKPTTESSARNIAHALNLL